MVKGHNYDQVYLPTASWTLIRLLLTLFLLHGWETRTIDYVMAYPQAPADQPFYMEIPKGFTVGDGSDEYLLEVHRNIYGAKQGG